MTNLSDLIERVEAAEEGSAAMDREIADAVLGKVRPPFVRGHCAKYSTSLDAAMTLAPTGRRMSVQQRRSYEPLWVSFMIDGGTKYDATGRARTLALAIVAASLRALQEKDRPHA